MCSQVYCNIYLSYNSADVLQVGGGRVFDEVEVDAELQKRRHAQQGYIEPSFPTIAGKLLLCFFISSVHLLPIFLSSSSS